ncbi:hypothetical protein LCGC14_2000120 [marine sediment metagenome]|uniref:Uncharacterized protein n=1 Tax=marine sediment metagenome TaxID=412755 RepID=A0A0F9F3R1_9ZZZZ
MTNYRAGLIANFVRWFAFGCFVGSIINHFTGRQ